MTEITLAVVLEVIWIGGLSVWILMERRSPQATLSWIIALALLPYIGIAVYMLVGPRRLKRKRRRYAQARSRVVQVAADVAAQTAARQPEAPLDPKSKQFAEMVYRADASPPTRTRDIELLLDGDTCYRRLEEAIAAARHHVHLEYYIWQPDTVGTRFRDLLCEKARQGVRVRMLVDAIGSSRLGRKFIRPALEAGVDFARFNRLSWSRFRPGMLNFRTHRKIVVCDGRVGFTGGINLCDDHSARASGHTAWRDTHLRLEGAAVRWLQRVFLDNWYFATGTGPHQPEYFPHDADESTGPWVQIVSSGPDCDQYAIHKLYFSLISAAVRRVWLTTPYFVPDEAILAALVTAAMRGVDVRVLVPRKGDSRLVTAAAESYFDELLPAGIHIHQFGPGMIHAKTLVVDDTALVGTANMDNRSFRLNFEVLAAVYDAAFAATLGDAFEADLKQSERYTGRQLKKTPFFQRLTQSTARVFSPLL